MACLRCIVCVFAIFFFSKSFAQSNGYKFNAINTGNGLTHNKVNCFLKDSRGFMWFGVQSGLNRYDGYSIKVFRHDPTDSTSLSDDMILRMFEGPGAKIWVFTNVELSIYDSDKEQFISNNAGELEKFGLPKSGLTSNIRKIFKDKNGGFWFLYQGEGLFLYHSISGKKIKLAHDPEDPSSIYTNFVSSISEGEKGSFWITHRNGTIEQLDGKTFKVIYRTLALYDRNVGEILSYNQITTSKGILAITPDSDNRGMYLFDTRKKQLIPVNKNSGQLRLNTDIVRDAVEDDNGKIWVGTDHGGVNILDLEKQKVTYVLHSDTEESSLTQNSIQAIYKDDEGIIWIGTYKMGACYYHEDLIRFNLFKHRAGDDRSLNYDDVNRFVEDDKGNLWIGTNGGGLIYFDRKNNTFKQYLNNPADPNSLSNNVIVSLCLDSDKKLWIGTFYGGLNCFDGKKFKRYNYDPANPKSISDRNVWEIFEDADKNIWIGTLWGGMNLYNRAEDNFKRFKLEDNVLVHSNYIVAFAEDRNKNLYFGGGYGLDVLTNNKQTCTHYLNVPNDPNSLLDNNIFCIIRDKRGYMWIGTNEGIAIFNPQTKKFKNLGKAQGFHYKIISNIVEDNSGNFWATTSEGLCKLALSGDPFATGFTFVVENYDETDGLQGRQFNENAAYKTSSGELVFGGANGFNIFNPAKIKTNKNKPKVILSDFQIFNQSIKAGEKTNGRVLLEKSIGTTQHITLKYSENIISFEFAALNFFHPLKNKFKYKLEGFNNDWMSVDGNSRKVTYTNLDPGEYVLRVKASNNDGLWNDEGIRLAITVMPPFWRTRIAYFVYFLFIAGLLVFSRQMIIERAKARFKIEQERIEARRMHELDLMKIKFFTNVSHEFKTPLTLIINPLEDFLKSARDAEKNRLLLMYRNARRLLNLVNELLDFRRMEVQEVKFNPSKGDIIKFTKEVFYSFSDLSERKGMDFSFKTDLNDCPAFFDHDKLERILFNLLSNAFKFTPSGGRIAVEVNIASTVMGLEPGLKWLRIEVSDTGIGIPAEKQALIFERFFQDQTPDTIMNQGSGIGLSIVKEFVRISGGTVSVQSQPDKGSSFIVLLPLREINESEDEATDLPDDTDDVFEPELMQQPELDEADKDKVGSSKPLVLITEDNEDFRFYLKDNLREHFEIIEAANGREGWQKTLSEIPDLIVSDVTMPEMNGTDFCKKIKNDPRTSHIPVILLTAHVSEEQKVEGFEIGANDYIAKPFNFEILLSRIKNLISQQEKLKKAYQKQIEVRVSDVNVTSLDEKLIQNAIKCVEDNISNPDFSVEEMSRELGMSRVYLYKKLLSLTNKTPIEFIRIIRLQRAAQLLEKSQLTVAEIAYQVGFNNPKYFTKYFKKQYKVLPSNYSTKKS